MSKKQRQQKHFDDSERALRSALFTMTNKRLRYVLRHQMLPVSGNKSDLVMRLCDHIKTMHSIVETDKVRGTVTVTLIGEIRK